MSFPSNNGFPNSATGGGGGGSVNSVSGNIVNNTDPTNPVVTQVKSDWNSNTGLSKILNKPSLAFSNTVFVAKNGDDANSGVYGSPKLTVSAALSVASVGNVVFVMPGIYTENINIPAGVFLNGTGPAEVTIVGNATINSTGLIGAFGLTLTATSGNIMTISGSTTPQGVFDNVLIESGSPSTNCLYISNTGGAILLFRNSCALQVTDSAGGSQTIVTTAGSNCAIYMTDITCEVVDDFANPSITLAGVNTLYQYNCKTYGTITVNSTSSYISNNCEYAANNAIIDIEGNAVITNATVACSVSPCITGSGTLSYSNLTYILSGQGLDATLNGGDGALTLAQAPILLEQSLATTTKYDGQLFYNGTHFYVTIGSTNYQLDQQSAGSLGDFAFTTNTMSTTGTNEDMNLSPNGSGNIYALVSNGTFKVTNLAKTAGLSFNIADTTGVRSIYVGDYNALVIPNSFTAPANNFLMTSIPANGNPTGAYLNFDATMNSNFNAGAGPQWLFGVNNSYTSIPTAAGTSSITNLTTVFTGTTTQIGTLVNETTVPVNYKYLVINKSTGVVTINDSSNALVYAVQPNSASVFTSTSAGAATGNWQVYSFPLVGITQSLSSIVPNGTATFVSDSGSVRVSDKIAVFNINVVYDSTADTTPCAITCNQLNSLSSQIFPLTIATSTLPVAAILTASLANNVITIYDGLTGLQLTNAQVSGADLVIGGSYTTN